MLRVEREDRRQLIDPLYETTPGFWLLVLVLAGLVAGGVYLYVRQVVLGLGETGLNRPVFWGIYMVNFIFLIGVSMAGTLISAALQLTGANWRRPITRVAETLTVFGLLIAGLQILFDMGRPEKVLAVIWHGRLQSPLLWDATSLTLYILASMGALYLQLLPDIALLRDNVPERAPAWRGWLYGTLAMGWRGNRTQWLRLEKAITVVSILIIPIGISLHTVTSWIFSTTVQPGWKSTILGPYFVVGAVFSGIGMLFLVMTFFRQRLGLQDYFGMAQYRNLNWLFIVMSIVWFYFTYTEHLTLVAGQETMEFPVLASKLFGEFSWSFWGMVLLMLIAAWVLIVPLLLPDRLAVSAPFRGRVLLPQAVALGVILYLRLTPAEPVFATIQTGPANAILTVVTVLLLLSLAIGGAFWVKRHFIAGLMIASLCVVVGMWLERWNIIIPTVTHPRLVQYATYVPTFTEIGITIASLALLALLTTVFFKLFPVVSIWEVAEGRVIDEAEARVVIPPPPTMTPQRRRFVFRRRFGREE